MDGVLGSGELATHGIAINKTDTPSLQSRGTTCEQFPAADITNIMSTAPNTLQAPPVVDNAMQVDTVTAPATDANHPLTMNVVTTPTVSVTPPDANPLATKKRTAEDAGLASNAPETKRPVYLEADVQRIINERQVLELRLKAFEEREAAAKAKEMEARAVEFKRVLAELHETGMGADQLKYIQTQLEDGGPRAADTYQFATKLVIDAKASKAQVGTKQAWPEQEDGYQQHIRASSVQSGVGTMQIGKIDDLVHNANSHLAARPSTLEISAIASASSRLNLDGYASTRPPVASVPYVNPAMPNKGLMERVMAKLATNRHDTESLMQKHVNMFPTGTPT